MICYGGTLDVKNKTLTVKYARVDLGDLNWTYDSANQRYLAPLITAKNTNRLTKYVCDEYTPIDNGEPYNPLWNDVIYQGQTNVIVHDHDYTDATAFTNHLNTDNVRLTYELATPTVITGLSDTDIRTLLGNNNIFADSGDIDKVTYFKPGCESIARLIEAYK